MCDHIYNKILTAFVLRKQKKCVNPLKTKTPKKRKAEFTSAVKRFYDKILTTKIFALAKRFA
jgi:hypothetical protein